MNGNHLKHSFLVIYPLLIYFVMVFVMQFLVLTVVSTADMYREFDKQYPNNSATLQETMEFSQNYMTEERTLELEKDMIRYSQSMSFLTNLILLIPFLIIFFVRKKRMGKWYDTRPAWYWYVLTPVAGVAVCLGANLLLSVLGVTGAEEMEPILENTAETTNVILSLQSSFAFKLISAGLIAPLLEEVLFTGIMYREMRSERSIGFSMFWIAALYAVNYGSLGGIIYGIFLSICVVFLYEKYRNLWAPILFHVGMNLFSVCAEYFNEFVNDALGSNFRVWVVLLFCICLAGFCFVLISSYVNKQDGSNNETEQESKISV